jgi:starvation-inducible DNA-binding protein
MLLFMNYKHYHWQVFGPHFRDLHHMFDEFAAETIGAVDEFAERVRMIGQDPPFDPNEILELATVTGAARRRGEHRPNLREMIAEADANLLGVIIEMREAAHEADEAMDPGTNDLYSRTVQIFEKQEWYLRDILERGDALA